MANRNGPRNESQRPPAALHSMKEMPREHLPDWTTAADILALAFRFNHSDTGQPDEKSSQQNRVR